MPYIMHPSSDYNPPPSVIIVGLQAFAGLAYLEEDATCSRNGITTRLCVLAYAVVTTCRTSHCAAPLVCEL